MMYKAAPLFKGGETVMFTEFRIRYPKGSLLTELAAIDHGKYIVRCLVQDEGITLVTSLAAAESVELAEDQARSRALTILGIYPTTANGEQEPSLTTPEVLVPPNPTPQIPPVFSSNTSEQIPPTRFLEVTENGSDLDTLHLVTQGHGNTQTQKDTVEEFSSVGNSAVTNFPQPLDTPPAEIATDTENSSFSEPPTPKRGKGGKRAAKTPRGVEEMTFGVSDDYSVAEVETSVPDDIDTPLWMAEKVSPSPVDEAPVLSSSESELETDTSQQPESKAPIDFSEIIARTNVELKRLGWTNQQGRDYLVQTYGKRSRQLLTDDELLDFLHHLESEPTPEG